MRPFLLSFRLLNPLYFCIPTRNCLQRTQCIADNATILISLMHGRGNYLQSELFL